MEQNRPIVRFAAPLIFPFVLFLMLFTPSASACSLAEPLPDWLQFVLGHGLATLNPDCTLTWKTGEMTDLNGNLVTQPIYAIIQRYGIAFFIAGAVLTIMGVYLTIRSRRLAKSIARANPSTQPM